MKARDITTGKLFSYKGKTYQWKEESENWRYLCDEEGNKLPPREIPREILLDTAEIADNDNEENE